MQRFWALARRSTSAPTPNISSSAREKELESDDNEDSFHSIRSHSINNDGIMSNNNGGAPPSSLGDSTNYFSAHSEDAFEYTDVSDTSSLGSAPPNVNAWSIQTGTSIGLGEIPQNGNWLDLASLSTPVTSNQSPLPRKPEPVANGAPRVVVRNFSGDNDDEFNSNGNAESTTAFGIIRPLNLSKSGSSREVSFYGSAKSEWPDDISLNGSFDKGYDEPPEDRDDDERKRAGGFCLFCCREIRQAKRKVKCCLLLLILLLLLLIVLMTLVNTVWKSRSDNGAEVGRDAFQLPTEDVPSAVPGGSMPPTASPSSVDIFDSNHGNNDGAPEGTTSLPTSTPQISNDDTLKPSAAKKSSGGFGGMGGGKERPTAAPTSTPAPTFFPTSAVEESIEDLCVTSPQVDSPGLFYVHLGESRDCAWLAGTEAWQRVLCVPTHPAYTLCRLTCGSCDGNRL